MWGSVSLLWKQVAVMNGLVGSTRSPRRQDHFPGACSTLSAAHMQSAGPESLCLLVATPEIQQVRAWFVLVMTRARMGARAGLAFPHSHIPCCLEQPLLLRNRSPRARPTLLRGPQRKWAERADLVSAPHSLHSCRKVRELAVRMQYPLIFYPRPLQLQGHSQ